MIYHVEVYEIPISSEISVFDKKLVDHKFHPPKGPKAKRGGDWQGFIL